MPRKSNETSSSFIFIQTIVLFCLIRQSEETLCQDPENVREIKANLSRKLEQVFFEEMSLYNNPDFLLKANESLWTSRYELNASSSTERIVRHQRLNGEPSCLKTKTSKGTTVCPSYAILEYDSDREPVNMVKVRCTCRKCYDAHATLKCGRKCWTENKCKEVNSYIPVIRRYCVKGLYEYMIDIETVPVGCTCKQRDILDIQ